VDIGNLCQCGFAAPGQSWLFPGHKGSGEGFCQHFGTTLKVSFKPLEFDSGRSGDSGNYEARSIRAPELDSVIRAGGAQSAPPPTTLLHMKKVFDFASGVS
jgi:hypothetical protein